MARESNQLRVLTLARSQAAASPALNRVLPTPVLAPHTQTVGSRIVKGSVSATAVVLCRRRGSHARAWDLLANTSMAQVSETPMQLQIPQENCASVLCRLLDVHPRPPNTHHVNMPTSVQPKYTEQANRSDQLKYHHQQGYNPSTVRGQAKAGPQHDRAQA